MAEVIFLGAVGAVLLAIAVCDARWQVVPAVLIWPALLGSLTFRVVRGEWWPIVAGAVVGGLMAIPTAIWGEERAGLGDAQVYGLVGLALGGAAVYVVALASLTAGLYGKVRRRQAVPVVPFIAGATLVVWSVGLVQR